MALQTTVASACARLAVSRESLRLAMRGPVTAAAQDGLPAPTWWNKLLAVPAIGVLHDVAMKWWARHPWHTAGNAAASAVSGVLQPAALRHPWLVAAAAVLVGGLITAVRPWRWRATMPTGAAGTVPRMVTDFISSMPVASWLVLLAALAKAVAPGSDAAAAPAAPAGPPTDPDSPRPAAV